MVGECVCLCGIKCVIDIIRKQMKLSTKADSYLSKASRTIAFREDAIV